MAEDTNGIVKIGVFLGFVFLIVALFYPSESGWSQFQLQIQNFPTFENPFDSDTFEIELLFIDDWVEGGTQFPAAIVDTGSVTHCDPSLNPNSGTEWWGCLLTQDAEVSYVSTNATRTEFGMNLSDLPGAASGLPILGLRITTQCNSTVENQSVDYLFYNATEALQFQPGEFFCGFNEFSNVSFTQRFDTPYPIVSSINGGHFEVNPSEPVSFVNYSYINIVVIVGTTTQCSGADTLTYIGCIISGFFNFIIRGISFIINGIVFVGQVIAYFLSIIVAFFGMMTFFFSLPGAPTIVQTIVSVIVIGCLLYILLSILKIARGTGTAG